MVPVRLGYERVLLRRFVAADADRVALLCSDWAVAGTTALIPHPYTHDLALEWIASQEPPTMSAAEHVYAVTRRADELLVGAVGLRNGPGPDANDLGYWIGKPYWGCGYATSAAAAVIGIAFAHLALERIAASHLARNSASGRVMEKCGMLLSREEMRPHRGGAPELFRVWTIDAPRWQAWTGR